MMLYKLLSRLDRAAFVAEVISLTDIGPMGEKIRALGVPVRSLGMSRGVPNPLGLLRLVRWLRRNPPQVIQTWMYHADLIGGLAARLAGRIPVAWGIQSSTLDPEGIKRRTIWIAAACARLSRWLPSRIVCAAESARQLHIELGYDADKVVVIPNAFDLAAFRPDPAARQSVRQELGIPDQAPLIGLMGRFHPQKDHRTFVKAASLLHRHRPEAHFLLCGDGVAWNNPELTGWIEAAGLRARFHLLGPRDDMARLNAALDIASLTSIYGEALPNVLGEAMACGVPCVVTPIGDSSLLVGDTGKIVPPQDPPAVAEAWRSLIEAGPDARQQLGLTARRRIEEHYSLPTIVAQYERLYQRLARPRA
jgi:glycosyltransferase involved in cell wall biosynthesis